MVTSTIFGPSPAHWRHSHSREAEKQNATPLHRGHSGDGRVGSEQSCSHTAVGNEAGGVLRRQPRMPHYGEALALLLLARVKPGGRPVQRLYARENAAGSE